MKRIVSVILMGILALSLCGCGDTYKKYGEFYSLQEAYEQGYISKEDLTSIAYYNYGSRQGNEEIMEEDYIPLPKNPATLTKKQESQIKKAAEKYFKEKVKQSIVYLGYYNEFYVVRIPNINPRNILDMSVDSIIDNVHFQYGYGDALIAWKENSKKQ